MVMVYERADAGRNDETCLARPNSEQSFFFFLFQLSTKAGLATNPVDAKSIVCDDHTYMHQFFFDVPLVK